MMAKVAVLIAPIAAIARAQREAHEPDKSDFAHTGDKIENAAMTHLFRHLFREEAAIRRARQLAAARRD
jgi:hypothetical protein